MAKKQKRFLNEIGSEKIAKGSVKEKWMLAFLIIHMWSRCKNLHFTPKRLRTELFSGKINLVLVWGEFNLTAVKKYLNWLKPYMF